MDPFSSIEETLKQIAPILMAGPGLILVLSGLFLWPGGLRFLRPLAASFASVVGTVAAWMFTDRTLVPMLCLGLIPALVAMVLDKLFVVTLGACLAGGVVLAAPAVTDAEFRSSVTAQTAPMPTADQVTLLESVDYVQQLIGWAGQWLQHGWTAVSTTRKSAAAGAVLGVLLLGAVAWRWVCALTCAALGTTMILAGTTLLLLSKGSQTVATIVDYSRYLWPAVGGMIVIGTLLNRWLCPARLKPQKPAEQPPAKGDEK